MIEREDLGRWMEGPPSARQGHPGSGLGRPESGPGSVARFPRRLAALMIDWLLVLIPVMVWAPEPWQNALTTAGWWAMTFLLVGTTGHTVGHALLGMQVQTLDGRPAGMARAFVRTVLIMLIIPPLIMDRDQRGLQDRAVGTVLVRIR